MTAPEVAFRPEHHELRGVVRSFLATHSPETEVRKAMETPTGFDRGLWLRMSGELGLAGLAVPEQYGGAGAGPIELGLVAEELGRALACSPFLSSAVLAVEALVAAGDGDACSRYLPAIAAGTCVATLAIAESDGRWDPTRTSVEARWDADAWRLVGTRMFVTDGAHADLLLLTARTPDGVALFTVDPTDTTVTRTALAGVDRTRRQARIDLDGSPARMLADHTSAIGAVARAWDVGCAVLAAEQVGAARRVLDVAVEHACARVQFGRPIGSFQAVKHKLAEMLIEVESARSAAYRAMWTAADPRLDLAPVAALAQAYCSDAFAHVAAESIQVYGGVGFTWEHQAHLYLKRALGDRQLLGDPRHHRERIAELLDREWRERPSPAA